MKKPNLCVLTASCLAALSSAVTTGPARAAATVKIDDTKWVSVGAGLRTSFNTVEDAAASGNDRSKDFRLDNIRLYVNGQIHEYIKFTFNTERQDDGSDDDIRVLDAIGQFEFNELFNVWAGRFLPPSDRSNLDGPFYLAAWNFPFVSNYPAIFAGRDDGVALWGETELQGTQVKYQVGAFQGCNDGAACDTGANTEDDLLYAGRVTVNLWDPEPGYYNASTYYGEKDILAIGLVVQTQSDAVGTAADPKDFFGWNLDGLMEKKLANDGVVSLEGAYYDYDLDNATVTGSLIDGNGYFVLLSYLFPQRIGIGRFQPQFRYQDLDNDAGPDVDQWELGVNYIIDGHNARISALYGQTDPSGRSDSDFFQIGLQLQI